MARDPALTRAAARARVAAHLVGLDARAMAAAHNHVLTPEEERDIVATCKELNSFGQGIAREHLSNLVVDSLKLRSVLNKGRNYTPLSHNAKQVLAAGEVGLSFFTRFFADHEDISERRPCAEAWARMSA